MDAVRGYLISLVAACMICAVSTALVKNGRMHKIVRFLGGILIALAAVTPLLSLRLDDLTGYLAEFDREYSLDVEGIEETTQSLLRKHIKQTAQTYIESKAEKLGASIQAEVTLDDGEYPKPIAARITGTLTPEQLAALSQYMTEALGIAQTAQEWRLYETDG